MEGGIVVLSTSICLAAVVIMTAPSVFSVFVAVVVSEVNVNVVAIEVLITPVCVETPITLLLSTIGSIEEYYSIHDQ